MERRFLRLSGWSNLWNDLLPDCSFRRAHLREHPLRWDEYSHFRAADLHGFRRKHAGRVWEFEYYGRNEKGLR